MAKSQFFVIEFDGTENGPFATDFQATKFCTKHGLVSFHTIGKAEKFINDYGQEVAKDTAVIVKR